MGLTIHNALASATRSEREARRLVVRLRARALDLPFERVGPGGRDGRGVRVRAPRAWRPAPLDADPGQPDGRARRLHRQRPARRLLAFSTGSEPAHFGLRRYPRYAVGHDGRKVRTGMLSRWCWRSFCKTQYSSNPDVDGTRTFLRCQLSLIAHLDHARELGVLHGVSDEGGY